MRQRPRLAEGIDVRQQGPRVLSSTGDPAAVAQRGRDAGAALGSDAAEAVAGIADRVLARVSAAEGTALSRRPSVACV